MVRAVHAHSHGKGTFFGLSEAGATIAFMAKFKPVKGKHKTAPPPRGGIPCIILLASGMTLVILLLYSVMKYANG